jgi:hypothetical protein
MRATLLIGTGLIAASMNKDAIGEGGIFAGRIEMYFGSPSTSELLEALEQRAIYKNLSTQSTLLQEFRDTFNFMKNKKIMKFEEKNYAMNFFDSHCVVYADVEGAFFSPKVELGTYIHDELESPKLVLEDGFLRNKSGAIAFTITDSVIEKLGQSYEEFFNFQFIGFNRV